MAGVSEVRQQGYGLFNGIKIGQKMGYRKPRETLNKSFAQIVQTDFLSVCSKSRRNTDVLRGFFGQTGGKYANKMCELI